MNLPDPASRHLALEGAFNFRHVGGYRAARGTVRPDLLWRSDGLHRLTTGDLHRLAGLGLRTVIDLRTAAERDDGGPTPWRAPAPTVHHLPLMDVLPSADGDVERWSTPAAVAAQYLGMVERGRPALAGALTVLADGEQYPAVVHCMAGKDRTGIIIACVLGLLGVSKDDIVADYALSAAAMERMIARLRVEHPERAEQLASRAAAAVGAQPETMAHFVDGVLERYGSWESMADAAGVPDAGDRLRAVLLLP